MLFTILGGIAFLCGGCISHGLAEFDFFLHSTLLLLLLLLLLSIPFFLSCLFILPASHLVLSVFCPPFFSGSCSTNASQSQDWSSPVTCFSVIGPPPPPGSAYLREAPPISHLAQRCGGATLLSPAAPHDVTDQLNI